ncbi:MAG TPA: Clp protease N-terminal domain-containing protein [Aldersonia sp.]
MFERFTRSARAVVIAAQEQARDLHSPTIDVEHVLLGVLATADGPLRAMLDDVGLTHDTVTAEMSTEHPLGPEDAEALRSIGIDLDAIRRSLDDTFGPDALDRAQASPTPPDEPKGWLGRVLGGNHIPFSAAAKKTLELALREAIARKDSEITAEHLLLGIVRAPNATTKQLIEAHIALPDLRRRVTALLDRAA